MADYPINTPYNLDEMDPNNPAGTEEASLIDDALRQTRKLVKEVFLKEHDPDGKHKVMVASSIPDGAITSPKLSSSTTEDSLRAVGTDHIKDGAVTAPKIATDAVTTAKIANIAVTAGKLATDAVETAKIKDANVTNAKLENGCVDSLKLKSDVATDANRAVTTNHIRDSAVVNAKVADKTLSPGKINLTADYLLVGDATGAAVEAEIGGVLTLSVVPGAPTQAIFGLVTDLSKLGYVLLREQRATGTNGGSSAAATWNERPVSGATWSKVKDSQSVCTLASSDRRFKLKKGVYIIRAAAIGYGVGKTQLRIRNYTAASTDLTGMTSCAPVGTSQELSMYGVLEVAADTDVFGLEHYTELANADDGLGYASSSGEAEVYATIEMIRLA